MISAKKNFLVHFLSQNHARRTVAHGKRDGSLDRVFILESHVMLRHKMDTKQQGEQIEHKPKKQAKYKKHYCFPKMSKKSKKCLIAASAGEKSQ